MEDNIVISKIWQDKDFMELKVCCSSSIANIITKIYVTNSLIDHLVKQIKRLLEGNVDECSWANEEIGDFSTACLSLRFIKKDKSGHIYVEVFAELDDGGEYTKHNCCFYVNTEYGLLGGFCQKLVRLKTSSLGCEIQMNDI